jgi:hypothetical protein
MVADIPIPSVAGLPACWFGLMTLTSRNRSAPQQNALSAQAFLCHTLASAVWFPKSWKIAPEADLRIQA